MTEREARAYISGLTLEEKMKLNELLRQVGAEARETFPKRFAGRSDQEVINEVAAVARRAGVTV